MSATRSIAQPSRPVTEVEDAVRRALFGGDGRTYDDQKLAALSDEQLRLAGFEVTSDPDHAGRLMDVLERTCSHIITSRHVSLVASHLAEAGVRAPATPSESAALVTEIARVIGATSCPPRGALITYLQADTIVTIARSLAAHGLRFAP